MTEKKTLKAFLDKAPRRVMGQIHPFKFYWIDEIGKVMDENDVAEWITETKQKVEGLVSELESQCIEGKDAWIRVKEVLAKLGVEVEQK